MTKSPFARIVDGFIRVNISLSEWVERKLPADFNVSLLQAHEIATAERANAIDRPVIMDVGGGRSTPFADRLDPAKNAYLLAADIDPGEISLNEKAAGVLVFDATKPFPLRDKSCDLIVTRSVMEHLPVTEPFIKEASRVLTPEGSFISVMPCRYSPFAILNRVLPNAFTKKAIARIFPQWADSCGFIAHYTDCYMPKMAENYEKHGFDIEELKVRYYQSIYFKWIFPIYLISLTYDLFMYSMKIKRLGCQLFIVAKPSQNAG